MKQKTINYVFWALSAVTIIIYFYLVYRFTINIPEEDDFPAIQEFILKFNKSGDVFGKLSLLLEEHSSSMHRLLFMRIIILFVYILTGRINYTVCIFIANILLVGLGALIYCSVFRNKDIKRLCLLIIALLLFNGQNLSNSVWAMSGLANFGNCFIAFLSIYLLIAEKRKYFIFGILLSLLTIYSNGGGMFIIPPVIICFMVQKRTKELIVFGCVTINASVLYFYNLNLSRSGGNILNNIPVLVNNFFIFVGCNFWVSSMKIFSFFSGLCCFVVYVWGILNKNYRNNLFCYACLTFLYLSAFAVAVGGIVLGFEVAIRYRIYGSLFFILTFIVLADNINKRYVKMLHFMLIPVLCFSLFSSTVYILKAKKILEWKKVSAYNWSNKIERLACPWVNACAYLKEAELTGIYTMPQYSLAEYKSIINIFTGQYCYLQDNILYKIEQVKKNENYIIIQGWAYLTTETMDFTNIVICLNDSEKKWICYPNFERRYDLVKDLSKTDCGFLAVIDKRELNPGEYTVEIGIKRTLKIFDPVYFTTTKEIIKLEPGETLAGDYNIQDKTNTK
jgi:hypothetical protein